MLNIGVIPTWYISTSGSYIKCAYTDNLYCSLIYCSNLLMETIPTYGEIYHMEFSENSSQLFKFEPQPSHFNKSQHSLHCTVKHTGDDESPFCYIFHLSDEMKHNHAFTSAVVNDIIQKHGLPLILRFKSDNSSMQYKFIWVFRFWSNLAKKLNTKIIIYYGV